MNYSLHVFFMVKHIILLLVLSIGLFFSYEISFAEVSETIIVTNCDGTRVSRTEAGQLVVTHIEAYSPGCVWGSRASESKQSNTESQKNTDSTIVITNCSGMRVTRTGTRVMITRAQKHLENCIMTNTGESDRTNLEKYNADNGPALDIRSTDIVHYRTLQMKNKWIRYVNPTRSVKMRAGESMLARVRTYLMKNDAVIITGKESWWVRSIGTTVSAPDQRSNEVLSDTTGKATGYIASGYLRDPNASDLVRIEQADQAYWSDIAHVQVAHLVNVRAHPWYGSRVLATLSDQTDLYIVSTIDNWSEVISDDRILHGYIRSDYLRVDHAQRVDR